MAYDMRNPANLSLKTGTAKFTEHDRVQMRPPAHPTSGVVADDEPLVVGGVRYWLVAWSFGGERRVAWSPESAIRAI
jgi:hypothetical protein